MKLVIFNDDLKTLSFKFPLFITYYHYNEKEMDVGHTVQNRGNIVCILHYTMPLIPV